MFSYSVLCSSGSVSLSKPPERTGESTQRMSWTTDNSGGGGPSPAILLSHGNKMHLMPWKQANKIFFSYQFCCNHSYEGWFLFFLFFFATRDFFLLPLKPLFSPTRFCALIFCYFLPLFTAAVTTGLSLLFKIAFPIFIKKYTLLMKLLTVSLT